MKAATMETEKSDNLSMSLSRSPMLVLRNSLKI